MQTPRAQPSPSQGLGWQPAFARLFTHSHHAHHAHRAHHLPRQAPNAYRVCSEQRSARGCSVQACEIHLFLNCSFRVMFVPSLPWLTDRSYTKTGAKKGVFRKHPEVAPAAAAPSLLLLSFGPLPLTPAPAAAAAAASGSAMFMDMKNPPTEKSGKQSSSSSSFSSGLPVPPAALLCCATSMQRSRYLSAAAA
jgi:hypothetical protein